MQKRAAICIGIDHPGGMTPLKAAVRGAQDFESWAKDQGCNTRLLIDENNGNVTLNDIFNAVTFYVNDGTFHQLIIYFSGHGILTAPGTEYWLLSAAPQNPNEAVNLFRSVEDARNSGIPHIIFISDACRSCVKGPPLSGVMGGVVFPNMGYGADRSEIDIFYATRPGDPAYEVPEAEATRRYRGIFTDCLLKTVQSPDSELIENTRIDGAEIPVVTSRKLKPYIVKIVPVDAATEDIKLRQQPELRVESALPKYFAAVITGTKPKPKKAGIEPKGAAPVRSKKRPKTASPLETIDSALADIKPESLIVGPTRLKKGRKSKARTYFTKEVETLRKMRGRGHFETRTGFTIFGAKPIDVYSRDWYADQPFPDPADPGALHIRLDPKTASTGRSSLIFQFEDGTGTVLPVLNEFIGTIVVRDRRVISVNYTPSSNSKRYNLYKDKAEDIEELKAYAAVASANGSFVVDDMRAGKLADILRRGKGFDPTLGLYAAYSYAQVGRYDDVFSVFNYMQDDIEIPTPFDVVMLALRRRPDYDLNQVNFAPFMPMLSQGWAMLMPGDPMFLPIHQKLRPYLIPALWCTLEKEGVDIARDGVFTGEVI